MNREDLKDEDVRIKISTCQKCNNVVRTAVSHMMSRQSKNEFAKEVMNYNLAVKEISLIEYRKMKVEFCECK